jgi:hypothetical protein
MDRYWPRGLLVLVLAATLRSVATAGCTAMDHEKNDNQAIAAKKAEYAIAAISNVDYQVRDSACIKANMQYLGMASLQHESFDVQKAVLGLIALLGYHVEPRPGHAPTFLTSIRPLPHSLRSGDTPYLLFLRLLQRKRARVWRAKMRLMLYGHSQARSRRRPQEAKTSRPEGDGHRARWERLERAVHNARDRWCRYASCKE